MDLVLGTATFGHWCDSCATVAGIQFPVSGIGPTGVVAVGDISVCPDCDDPIKVARAWRERAIAGEAPWT